MPHMLASGPARRIEIHGLAGVVDQLRLRFELNTHDDLGEDADNVRYDGRSRQILVGFGSGELGLVDASGQNVGTIPLSSHPESFQFEEGGSRIFVNVPKEFAVAVVDRTKHTVIAKWGLDWTFANYPMAVDEEDKRLFVGCRLLASVFRFCQCNDTRNDTSPEHLPRSSRRNARE